MYITSEPVNKTDEGGGKKDIKKEEDKNFSKFYNNKKNDSYTMKLFRIYQYLILVVTVETKIIPKCTCCCNNKKQDEKQTEQDQNLDFILKAFKIKKEDIIETRTIQIKNVNTDITEENIFKEVNKKSKVEVILSQRKRLKNNPDVRLVKNYYLKSRVNPDTTLLENITNNNDLNMWFLEKKYDSVNKKFITVGAYKIKASPDHA